MIYGIGFDCVLIKRIEKSMEKEHFLKRVFSVDENEYFKNLAQCKRAESVAANFAAKEAFLKACGTGLGGFALTEIAALREKGGKPYYKLYGDAKKFCCENNIKCHLSISHENGMAMAFAIMEV